MKSGNDYCTMRFRFMTVKSLKEACKKHPYILLRFASGYQMGINSKIAHIALKLNGYDDNQLTDFVSFLPCSFYDYISHKAPFMRLDLTYKINLKR